MCLGTRASSLSSISLHCIGIKQALRSRTDFEVCLFLIRFSDGGHDTAETRGGQCHSMIPSPPVFLLIPPRTFMSAAKLAPLLHMLAKMLGANGEPTGCVILAHRKAKTATQRERRPRWSMNLPRSKRKRARECERAWCAPLLFLLQLSSILSRPPARTLSSFCASALLSSSVILRDRHSLCSHLRPSWLSLSPPSSRAAAAMYAAHDLL